MPMVSIIRIGKMIDNPAIIASSYEENTEVTIAMLQTRPNLALISSVKMQPNLLSGYYNASIDAVELYMTDTTGYRYLRIT